MPGKELKKRAKMVLGDHYLLFVAVCLIAAFLGTEFSLSLNVVTLYTEDFSAPADPSVVTHFLSRKNLLEVVTELATGNREERDRISDEIIQDAIGYTQTARPVLEGQQGVLATIINSAYSGSFPVSYTHLFIMPYFFKLIHYNTVNGILQAKTRQRKRRTAGNSDYCHDHPFFITEYIPHRNLTAEGKPLPQPAYPLQ